MKISILYNVLECQDNMVLDAGIVYRAPKIGRIKIFIAVRDLYLTRGYNSILSVLVSNSRILSFITSYDTLFFVS